MKKQLLVIVLLVSTVSISCGEPKFKKLKSGLEIKFLKEGKTGKKAVVGSMITMKMKSMLKDSILYDSDKLNNGEPIPAQITAPSFNGDILEGLAMMEEGDSAIIKVLSDSLFKQSAMPEFIKKGDYMQFAVKMVSVKTNDEYQKELKEKNAEQNAKDDKIIADYIAKNGINAQKTESGIYYVIEKTGNGKHPTVSDKVKVNYKGTLLNGTVFDSSYERNEPAEFGLDQVIRGWTEGIPLLEEGGKGKLIIPSSLAYGQNAPPGSNIEPNSVLVFEVELLEILKR